MKKIVVASLNWGLGHASRCVPIIKTLLKSEFTPVIASDGSALDFLKKEFPNVETLELPSYHISYGKNIKRTLFFKTFSILKAAKKEKDFLDAYLNQNLEVVGVISDNRFGIYSKKVPCVYITHQINVFSGGFSSITSFFHQRIIKRFDECWIPDDEELNFSGKLSISNKNLNQKYIGVLSRLQQRSAAVSIDVLIVLSGPEPNRSQLEEKLKQLFKETSKKVWLVRGVIEKKQVVNNDGALKIFNFMQSGELEKTLNSSKFVICRSGYSSIMDLITLNKKALLIPTKGQDEQEYLARYLHDKGCFKYVLEENLDENAVKFLEYDFSYSYEKRDFNARLFDLFLR